VPRAAVLRGQEDAVLNDYSVGDWCFGYGSEPIPGTELARRGRNAKPRMQYTINEDHAAWVRQIFQWFVRDLKSLDWIAKELTQRGAPNRAIRPTTPASPGRRGGSRWMWGP
jgi:site-specific DNA recombinase